MHEGLYTDMNAIRRDEDLDNIHSIYVDQWDWERMICKEDRTESYLKETVQSIVDVICDASEALKKAFPQIKVELKREVSFVTSQELEDMYPDNTPEQREHLYLKEHKTAFIMKIGDKLRSGKTHGNRAPDYDDYSTPNEDGFYGLNGDLMIWSDVLGKAMELSSMGIRVDREALLHQLEKSGKEERKELYFHRRMLNGELPLSIGGGIGQSRLCMLLLKKAHIGEIQSSIWPDEMRNRCKEMNIPII
jgi:aspartate--ammonia ligase